MSTTRPTIVYLILSEDLLVGAIIMSALKLLSSVNKRNFIVDIVSCLSKNYGCLQIHVLCNIPHQYYIL